MPTRTPASAAVNSKTKTYMLKPRYLENGITRIRLGQPCGIG